jgi:hypothetical protein
VHNLGRGGASGASSVEPSRNDEDNDDQHGSRSTTESAAKPVPTGKWRSPTVSPGRDALLADFDRFLAELHPPHTNWTLTGIRGTGKTVLLEEFAGRGERAGWLCVER